ncbi:MAG: virulence protein SciE type [Proteobacteria bacterium]|nr:virulence protein SciE type [Pseudomonadota bacterium]
MQAEQSLHQGRPEEALAELQAQVRKDPSNPKLRVFLFQLLAVLGQWERAITQLQVAGELDAANLLMAQMYREAILCEVFRAEVFAGKRSPLIFGDPSPWIAFLVEALRLEAENRSSEAGALRAQAFEQAPATAGSVNGQSFEWMADADSRLGPVLEAIVNGRYYWIPLQCVRRLEVEEPADLRDVVWMPAQFTWANGGGASGLIPTRYAATENATDSLLLLSRRTEWQELADGAYKGLGQRILATNNEDYALMDVREIGFEPASSEVA